MEQISGVDIRPGEVAPDCGKRRLIPLTGDRTLGRHFDDECRQDDEEEWEDPSHRANVGTVPGVRQFYEDCGLEAKERLQRSALGRRPLDGDEDLIPSEERRYEWGIVSRHDRFTRDLEPLRSDPGFELIRMFLEVLICPTP